MYYNLHDVSEGSRARASPSSACMASMWCGRAVGCFVLCLRIPRCIRMEEKALMDEAPQVCCSESASVRAQCVQGVGWKREQCDPLVFVSHAWPLRSEVSPLARAVDPSINTFMNAGAHSHHARCTVELLAQHELRL